MESSKPGDYSSLPIMSSHSRRVSWCGHVKGGSPPVADEYAVVQRRNQNGRAGVSKMVRSATNRLSVIWATPTATEMDIPPLSSFIWNRVPIVYSGTLYYLEKRGILGTDGKWKKRLCFLDEGRLYVFEVPATAAEATAALGQPHTEPDQESLSSTATNSKERSGSTKRGWAIDLEEYEFAIENAPSAKNSPKMPQAFIFSSRGMKNDTQCFSAATNPEHDEWSSKLKSVVGELKKRNATPNSATSDSSSKGQASPAAGGSSSSTKESEINTSPKGATSKTFGKTKQARSTPQPPAAGTTGAKVKVKKQSKLAAAVAGFGHKHKEGKLSRQGSVADQSPGKDSERQKGSSVSGDPGGASPAPASEPWDSLTWETPLAGDSEFSDKMRGAYCYTSSDDDEGADKFGTDDDEEGDSDALSSFATISEAQVLGGKSYTGGSVKGAAGGPKASRGGLRTRRGRREPNGALMMSGAVSPGSFLRKASKQSKRFMANKFTRSPVDSHVYDAPVIRAKPIKDANSNDIKKGDPNKPSVSPQPEDSFYQAPKPILKPSASGGPSSLARQEDQGFSSISSTIELIPAGSTTTTTAGTRPCRSSLGINMASDTGTADWFAGSSFFGRGKVSIRQPQHTPPEYATLESSFRNVGKAKRNPLVGGEVFFATAKSRSQEDLAASGGGSPDDTFLAPDASLAQVVNFINLLVTEVARVHHKLDNHGTLLKSLEADVRRNTKDLGSLQENITLVAQSTKEALEAQKQQLQQQQQAAAGEQKGEKQSFSDMISSGAKACDAANKEAQATLEEARNIASELKGAREEFNLAKMRLEEMTKIISRFSNDQSMMNDRTPHHSQHFPQEEPQQSNNRRATLPRRGPILSNDRSNCLESVDEVETFPPDNVYANSCEAIKSTMLSSGSQRDPDEIQLMSTSTPSVCCPAASTATEEDDDTYDVPSNFVKPVMTSTSRSTVCSSSSSARSSGVAMGMDQNKQDDKGELLRQPSWESRDYATLSEIQEATARRKQQMANNNKVEESKGSEQGQSPQKTGFLANAAQKLFWSSASTATPSKSNSKEGKRKKVLLASRRNVTPALPPRNPVLMAPTASSSAANTSMTSAWSFGSNNSSINRDEEDDDSKEIYTPISEEGFEMRATSSPLNSSRD